MRRMMPILRSNVRALLGGLRLVVRPQALFDEADQQR